MTREVHALADSRGPLWESYDLLVLDLDGVVYVGSDAVPGADVALRMARDAGAALSYVTNNASRTPHDVAEHLRSLGMPLTSDADVVTSAEAAAHLVAKLLSLIHISEPTRQAEISYAVFCLKKKKKQHSKK